MLVPLESSSAVLGMISSKSVSICNHCRARLVDSSSNRTFSRGYPNLMRSYGGFVEPTLNEGSFPNKYKTASASVTPLVKKQGLDKDSLGNYRPVSNLHTISKIVERVFMTRLVEHVNKSPNYNRFQSPYTDVAIQRRRRC